MKICFLGQGKEIVELARSARAYGHSAVGIVTYPRDQHINDSSEHSAERERGLYESVFDYASKSEVDLLEAADVNSESSLSWLKARSIDFIISFRSRSILRKPLIDMYPGSLLNIHIGKLPLYRGSGAMSWMIMNGEEKSAVTYHYINDKIDGGDIIRLVEFDIPYDALPIDIYKICSDIIINSTYQTIELLLRGKLEIIKQDLKNGTYYPRLNTVRDGRVRFDYLPDQFEKFCRAFGDPYPGAHFVFEGDKVFLTPVLVAKPSGTFHPYLNGLVISQNCNSGSIEVVCGTGSVEVFFIVRYGDKRPANMCLRVGARLE